MLYTMKANVIGSMKFVTFFPNERSKNNVSNRNTRVTACCQKSTLAREDLDAAHQSIGVVMMYVHMTVVSYAFFSLDGLFPKRYRMNPNGVGVLSSSYIVIRTIEYGR